MSQPSQDSRIGDISGSIAATGETAEFQPESGRAFAVFLSGTGTATIQLERYSEELQAWSPIMAGGVQLYAWDFDDTTISEDVVEARFAARYRLNCTAFTDGQIDWAFEQ